MMKTSRENVKRMALILMSRPPGAAPSKTLEELGIEFGVTRSRVAQLEKRARSAVGAVSPLDDVPRFRGIQARKSKEMLEIWRRKKADAA